MKKITLIAVALTSVAAFAAGPGERNGFGFEEPVVFTERGIEFFVFPNGEFDFNTEASAGGTYFRRGGSTMGATHGGNSRIFGGVRIEHDLMGRVRRIGNVFVNYDHVNRIKRIGTVYMNYGRSGLAQVGGLKIIYDRRGNIVDMIGNVKGRPHAGYHNHYYGPMHGNYNSANAIFYKNSDVDELQNNKR